MPDPILSVINVSKSYTGHLALSDITLDIYPGEVHCLLGDNGAGKSTLIKILSGVIPASSGQVRMDGRAMTAADPREAREHGIATVHQYGGTVPLMSVGRNFFLGAEPLKGWGPFRRIDFDKTDEVALEQLHSLGIRRVTDAGRLVGTLSGGERQALAIARAVYFGARVLILDEPTSALGVKEAATVLQLIDEVRSRGVAVVLVTHNAHHALKVGDRFSVLIQGKLSAAFMRGEKTRLEVITLMAGGEEMEKLMANIE